MVALDPPDNGESRTYPFTVSRVYTNFDCNVTNATRLRTEAEIKEMQDWVSRFGAEKVINIDVLVELCRLNRKAIKAFTAKRRDGASEVEALVAAVWSIK